MFKINMLILSLFSVHVKTFVWCDCSMGIKLLLLSHHHPETKISCQSINGKREAKLSVIPSQSVLGRVECPVIEVAELLVELKEESDEEALKL